MQSRRDHLIDTALRLFYTGGFTATGIDKILAEAGVAKMTLYKHFRSKDDLILAVLIFRPAVSYTSVPPSSIKTFWSNTQRIRHF